ncbi:uncharacterized protein V1516DRAFT_58352 [Lipomyces oligophaga]|uniref:uncharacterized protein n=1 Tax=Lipomyces oligophaga TaxID=45792 RepID=UPI0034CD66C8
MQHLTFLPVHASADPGANKLVPTPRTPVNPFLAALFYPKPQTPRSRDLATALQSPQSYALLVPVTPSILFTIDSETSIPFAELCTQDDFLSSHILKIGVSTKAIGRARVFWTLSGRSVVIRDDYIYTNKGFKSFGQARMVGDKVYMSTSDLVPPSSEFLTYYISKPLIGSALPLYDFKALSEPQLPALPAASASNGTPSSSVPTKTVTTFGQLLSSFPLIARHIQEPLNRIFEEFDCTDATEPDLVTMIEEVMQKGIALFQNIDHSAVNTMASTTGLTGPEIEKMMENYVGKHLHNKIWPRLIVLRSLKDSIIRLAVKNMKNTSLGQLGVQPYWEEGGDSIERMVMGAIVDLENLTKGENAAAQIERLVNILRSLGVVPPSQHESQVNGNGKDDSSNTSKESKEKAAVQSNVSADVLVSLMIIVVAWSKLDHLDSLLFYMRNFSFMDVDTGEVGYALSTFEAVIFHIMNNSSKLAIVSSANTRFWKSIKSGEDIAPAFDSPSEYFGAGGIDVSEIDSLEQVYRARNSLGESALMMAVQAQPTNLANFDLLLSKRDVFPIEAVQKDQNKFQTTLLSAAVQTGDKRIVDTIWDFLKSIYDQDGLKFYLARKDEWQRGVGHYLFNIPELINTVGELIVWTDKDQNGQTPLFALCRSYDHPEYTELVKSGIAAATKYQAGGGSLRFLDHVDLKGNTLLHVMKDIPSLEMLLDICDIDLNRVNEKGLTPFMVNSKFSRTAAIDVLAQRPEVDITRRNFRGLNAAELAKDESTQARIENIMLFRHAAMPDGRVTSVLRGLFADETVQFVIKSGIKPNSDAITRVLRTYGDFTFMAKWLAYELPSSWIPKLQLPHNPFSIPSRPSRAVIRDVQSKLDAFLRTLLLHPTFGTHELLWEFFLVSQFSHEQTEKRSRQKAASHEDSLLDEYAPVDSVDEVVTFFNHALREMDSLDESFHEVTVCSTVIYHKRLDLADAYQCISGYFKTLTFLPLSFVEALSEFTALLQVNDSHEENFAIELRNSYSIIKAVIESLKYPNTLVQELVSKTSQLSKYQSSLNRMSTRLPLGILNDARARYANDTSVSIESTKEDIVRLGAKIRYSQTVLATELGGFNDLHEQEGLRIIKEYATEKIKWEKVRLKGLRGVLDKVKLCSRE